MVTIFSWIFIISLIIIGYSYIGYGLLAALLVSIKTAINWITSKDKSIKSDEDLPEVTLLIAAYNEEAFIKQKVENSLSLSYPEGRLKLIFVTDGSTDRTVDILKKYSGIRILHASDRSGKTAALNRAMKTVNTPITIFCDANTILCEDAVLRIVEHYKNPNIGGVAGEKRVAANAEDDAKAASEGIYWKYESILKKIDSALYTVVGAAGELFSIRTDLWEHLDHSIILDDFVISIRINLKGYKIAYSPDAYAIERPSHSIVEEQKRKIRISAGAFQAMLLLKEIFNVFRHPVLFFQFFSHRFLRWVMVPLCLPLLFLSNAVLLFSADEPLFFTLFITFQLLFYLFAVLGSYSNSNTSFKLMRICYYIAFMNFTVYLGFIRFLRGSQSAVWEKAKREVSSISI